MILFLFLYALSLPVPDWELSQSDTHARLRGVCAIDSQTAWVSGNQGTILLTTDGGAHWSLCPPPSSAGLDFRDIEAIDSRTAWVLATGPGALSRIYKTTDAGKSWRLVCQNRDAEGFFDAIAFWDANHGIVMGDPVDGRFIILATDDGGEHWQVPARLQMPPALAREGAFAASGTCLIVAGTEDAWFATGGAAKARVFHSADRGQTWDVAETEVIAAKASAGIFSLAFRDRSNGVAVGGDYQSESAGRNVMGSTADSGRTWKTEANSGLRGYRSCVVIATSPGNKPIFLSVGPTGTDRSLDGLRWHRFSEQGFHSADASPDGAVIWAVGEVGKIGRLTQVLLSR